MTKGGFFEYLRQASCGWQLIGQAIRTADETPRHPLAVVYEQVTGKPPETLIEAIKALWIPDALTIDVFLASEGVEGDRLAGLRAELLEATALSKGGESDVQRVS